MLHKSRHNYPLHETYSVGYLISCPLGCYGLKDPDENYGPQENTCFSFRRCKVALKLICDFKVRNQL